MTRVGCGCGPQVTAPVCRTMPSVLLVIVEGKKKEILNAYLFIFVLVFIYLYRLTQDPSSTVGLFEVLLPVIT